MNLYKNFCNNNNESILTLFKLIKCIKESENINNNTIQINGANIQEDIQFSEIINNKKMK